MVADISHYGSTAVLRRRRRLKEVLRVSEYFEVFKECFREFRELQEQLKGVSRTIPGKLHEGSRGSNEFQGQLAPQLS